MLVLGIDTATPVGSVGVVEVSASQGVGAAGAEATIRAEISRSTGLAHGAALLPMIDECLASAGIAAEKLDGVAVSIGPGSFTGLRVGLATAKGLVFGSTCALVGIPTLEALAEALVRRGAEAGAWPLSPAAPAALVCPCLDARKGEVYAALFEPQHGAPRGLAAAVARLSEDRAEVPEALVARVEAALAARSQSGGRVAFVGDGAERHRAAIEAAIGDRAVIAPSVRVHARGGVVALLGAARLRAGERCDAASLAPAYARASEAEKGRAAREAAGAAPAGHPLTTDLRGA